MHLVRLLDHNVVRGERRSLSIISTKREGGMIRSATGIGINCENGGVSIGQKVIVTFRLIPTSGIHISHDYVVVRSNEILRVIDLSGAVHKRSQRSISIFQHVESKVAETESNTVDGSVYVDTVRCPSLQESLFNIVDGIFGEDELTTETSQSVLLSSSTADVDGFEGSGIHGREIFQFRNQTTNAKPIRGIEIGKCQTDRSLFAEERQRLIPGLYGLTSVYAVFQHATDEVSGKFDDGRVGKVASYGRLAMGGPIVMGKVLSGRTKYGITRRISLLRTTT